MISVGTAVIGLLVAYSVATACFLIVENRRPQATLAWMFAFIFLPGLGLGAYFLFGRNRKAFAKQRKLLMQDLEANAKPLLSSLFARQDEEIAGLEKESGLHGKLMKLVRHNSYSALTTQNGVEILQDAKEFYSRLMEDMSGAKHSIHLQYFIWGADEFTEELKQILITRVQAGVEVRLLYDPLGSLAHLNSGYMHELVAAGVHVSPTAPLYRIHTISYRNHRKITVVDGTVGYTGGMNIGREHLSGGEGFTSWRDTQVRIRGEGARVLQAVFMIDWYNAVRENLFSESYFSKLAPQVPKGKIPVQILTSGPDSRWAAIRQLYFSMIGSAQKNVYIQSPYFVLDTSILESLRSAALAGVDVRVMLSARASGNRLPEWAGNTYILDVLSAGVRVFLYEKGYLHAKTISVDSEVCSIGSANIDIRSFSINYELNAVLYSKSLAHELEQSFRRDLESCREFDAKEYASRNGALRFRDSVARLLSPLL